jgi:hypothetical protein
MSVFDFSSFRTIRTILNLVVLHFEFLIVSLQAKGHKMLLYGAKPQRRRPIKSY